MRYYSTNNHIEDVSLFEAVTRSLAPDGGIYVPRRLPYIPKALFNNIADMSTVEVAYVVANSLFGDDVESDKINEIVRDTFSFEIPLRYIDKKIYSLELYHGPTNSFKDIGVRFMSKLLDYYSKREYSSVSGLNILVTTSGNTGMAVADAFKYVRGVKVFVFYPKSDHSVFNLLRSKSPDNVVPVEIRADYGTCVRLVNEVYSDKEINRLIKLTSANTLNIARLLPQIFIFFWAYSRLIGEGESTHKIAVSTPCGNLGNLTAALYSRTMGLPINRIMAAGKGNERLWGEISGGVLKLNDFNSKALSSNLSRINEIIKNTPELIRAVDCHTYSEDQILQSIDEAGIRYGYHIGRNSAMAFRALKENIAPDETGVFLATSLHGTSTEIRHNPYAGNTAYHTISATLPALKRFLLEQCQTQN